MENLETKTTEGQETETQAKTYTQEEVEALLQKETDRRVSSALKKQEQKNAEKVKEASRLASMDAQQRFEYELQQREQAIIAKEKELTLAENKNICSKILSEKGLSLDLVEFVVAEDAEAMDANIKKLERAFKNSVKAEVEKRLGSKEPKQNLPMNTTITKEAFKKMSIAEMERLSKEQPELFKELIRS